MKYVFQLGRILGACLLGELLAALLPLPIPASVYGLILLLSALKLGVVRLNQVKETGNLLIAILPILFIPAAVGVMDLWTDIRGMLLPCLLAVGPATLLVMGVTGLVTQLIQRRCARRGGGHNA